MIGRMVSQGCKKNVRAALLGLVKLRAEKSVLY